MNVNFSAQSNLNNTSFGQYKHIKIGNFDSPLKLAAIMRSIEGLNKNKKGICYVKSTIAHPIQITRYGTIMGMADACCTAREIDIYANSTFPRKLFNAIKNCLRATTIEQAEKIEHITRKKFSKVG